MIDEVIYSYRYVIFYHFELENGDLFGFTDKIQKGVSVVRQHEGNFTLRIVYELFQNIGKMDSFRQVMSYHLLMLH